jgi:hypothetical protein
MEFLHKLAITTITTTLSLTVINGFIPSPVQAISLINFEATLNTGVNTGQTFNGSFSYDETLVNSSGLSTLFPNNGLLSANFSYLGTDYTEVNDISFPNGPIANFSNGDFTAFEFLVDGVFLIDTNTFNDLVTNDTGTVVYSSPRVVSVPEKTVNPLLLMSFLGLGLLIKKSSSV